MKKFMPFHEKTSNPPKSQLDISSTSIKQSKSEIFFVRKHKRSCTPERKKYDLSKNDQRVVIYIDNTGFIVEYSILSQGLKCQCFITQTCPIKTSKASNFESIKSRQSANKKKIKLQINMTIHHLSIVKFGVQHIFPVPLESKNNLLKIVLAEDWQIQQFSIPSKKTKIQKKQLLSATQNNFDQIYPLKNIMEADELRKNKLAKSDSKIKISWGSAYKDSQEQDKSDKHNEIISFNSEKNLGQAKVMFAEVTKLIPRNPFLRKSLNECDQTRDSQEQHLPEEKPSQKQTINHQIQKSKGLHINLSQWMFSPLNKDKKQMTLRQNDMEGRERNKKKKNLMSKSFFS